MTAGMVHLGGQAVHHHQCTPACRYRPGWYTIADAIAILRALPGDYAGAIAELERRAGAGS